MKQAFLGCWLLLIAINASAHRLDECLQATLVSVATNRIDVEIDLTPGVAIADQLVGLIDKDRDGQVSEDEFAAYVQRVLKDIQLGLDEKVLALRVVDASCPNIHDIKGGLGVIRIKATASIGSLATGRHTLSLSNTHLPAMSVYLVNALVPDDAAIKISKQTRDELQKHYRLEFGVIFGR